MKALYPLPLILLFSLSVHAQEPRWIETQKLLPSDEGIDGHRNDMFGRAVAISGNRLIVGVPYEGEDVSTSDWLWFGAAYIFESDANGGWSEVQKLSLPDSARLAHFGSSVSISGDYAFVGTPGRDEVYVYKRQPDGVWKETQKLVALDQNGVPSGRADQFGESICVSDRVAIIGAWAENAYDSSGRQDASVGAAYIFERDMSGTWTQVQRISAPDGRRRDSFGRSVSVSGTYAIVGALRSPAYTDGEDSIRYAGAAYIFERAEDGTWNQARKIVAADREQSAEFGISVSISGDRAVVGAHQEDPEILDGVAMPDAGAAYVFERDGNGNWNRTWKLIAPDAESQDRFGYSVSLSGDYAIVGAYNDDNRPGQLGGMGSAHIFIRNENGIWSQMQRLVASDREEGDNFGLFVAIGGSRAVACAPGEDNLSGDARHESGAAYVFELSSTTHVADNPRNNALSFHPNPIDRTLHIDLGKLQSSVGITIRDLLGRTIIDQTFNATEAINLDIDGPSGVYLVVVRTADGGSRTLKVVKR